MINLSNTTPAALNGGLNVQWQEDASGNVSGYVANVKATVAPVAGVLTINAAAANSFLITVNAAITSMVITNPSDGEEIVLLWVQDATGHAVTLASNILNAVPVNTAANSSTCQILTYNSADTNWYAPNAASVAISGTANQVYATPNGSSGGAALRALAPADIPVATSSAFGAVKPDGTSITISGGVISAASTGAGTVTSVAVTVPSRQSVSGSPVTTSGTLAITDNSQSANTFFRGPNSGSAAAPTFGAIVPADLPVATTAAFGAVKPDGTTITAASGVLSATATGTVTSVGVTVPTRQTVTGSPVTGAGTLAITDNTQSANIVFAGPVSGAAAAPTFRAVVPADLPVATTSAFGAVKPDGTTITASSGVLSATAMGTVTSVGLTVPSRLTVTGSPVTGSGTLAITDNTQSANTFFRGPNSGVAATPTFGVIVAADLPVATTAAFGAVKPDGTTITISGGVISSVSSGGTVTSVGVTVPSRQTVTGSPVTGSGTLAITDNTQSANTFFRGPNTGAAATPTFGAIVAADLPLATTSAFGAVKPDGTSITISSGVISSTSSMVYPAAGIAVSTGTAWGTSLTAPTGNIVGTSDTQTLTNKSIDASQLTGTIAVARLPLATTGAAGAVIVGSGLAVSSGTLSVATTVVQTGTAASGQFSSSPFALTDGSTIAVNWSNGLTQKVTIAGNRTLTFSGAQTGARYLLEITQDGTGSRTLTWPTIRWQGGSAPTLTTTPSKTDLIVLVYDGTDYFGQAALNF